MPTRRIEGGVSDQRNGSRPALSPQILGDHRVPVRVFFLRALFRSAGSKASVEAS